MFMEKFSSFLNTYYLDCVDYYNQCIKNKNALSWDFVCITASNKTQANRYLKEIERRRNRLPSQTQFIVVPDYLDERVGSGGATLSVIKDLKEKYNCDFNKRRILIIHSGGDSKRIPQYSAIGKLFAPVPHVLMDGEPSTLFDELLMSVSYIPTKIKSGSLILSGDVLLVFNNLDFYQPKQNAAAISFKETPETGESHGVFVGKEDSPIASFLHKQPYEFLKQNASDTNGRINIDTGAVFFSSCILNDLYSLVDDKNKYSELVNKKVRLSFYGDFLYPLAEKSTLEQFYKEKPEGTINSELLNARTKVWNVLRKYRIILESFTQAKFVHFGTSKEVLELHTIELDNYSYFGWNKNICSSNLLNNSSSYLSVVEDSTISGKNVYIESSYVHKNVNIGNNSIVSFLELKNVKIPSDVVVHGLKLDNNKFVVRIFGINDNPKENKLFGIDIVNKMKELNINSDNVFNDDLSLWNANIYPVCDTIDEALNQSLNLYDIFISQGHIDVWISKKRESLNSSFNKSNSESIFQWNNKLIDIIKMENLYSLVKNKSSAIEIKKIQTKKHLSKNQKEWLKEKSETISFIDQAKIYHFLNELLDDNVDYIGQAYRIINQNIINAYKSTISYNDELRISKEKTIIKMPLRINFGGGWSDTPPYCNEHGGTVLNASILLKNEMPVSVSIQKISERKIIFKSDDMKSYCEFSDTKSLQSTGNPYDEFALPKAVLVATGVIPIKGGNLTAILKRVGGGFILKSEVSNVPKGSGLGTSSILAACCVKAVFDFFGIEASNDKISSIVLCVEQIMSTGGGWQDQIGGLYPGIKVITSKPGLVQKLIVEKITLSKKTIDEFNNRLVLISTGQRRLARNLLRSVISNYLTNNEDTLYALERIQNIAIQMKDALVLGDISLFGKLLDNHWTLSKMIDKGSSNILIEQIFDSIDDLICGRMVVGAGGGGFLQVILKKNVDKKELIQRINNTFKGTNVSVYDSNIYFD